MDSALSDFFLSAPPIKPWLHMPEVPLADEFMAETTLPLPLNDFEARPQLRGQYLETQYRLHRYEVVEPLRRAIQTLRSAQPQTQSTPINQNTDEIAVVKLENVNVYSRIRVIGYTFGRDGAGQRLVVPYAPVKDIDQDEAPDDVEIFCPGTLVVLSSDRFKSTCFVATVVKNEGLRDSPPTIDLLWAKQDYVVTDCTLELVMLEPTSGYFESLRYTMLGLQKMAKTSCVLNPYLFTSGPHTIPEVPYLEDTTDGKPVIPKTAKSLDKSQYKAFEEATTREISLIQGPPGTGKTFTSVVILQSLVETQRQCHVERRNSGPRIPVLVTAQTNHALDQLLKKYKNNPGCGGVIRLGGRSNDEEISELTLAKQMRKNTPGFRHQSAGRLYSEAKLAITAVQQSHTLDNATDAKELRDHGLLSDDQYYSIVDDDWESNDGDDGNDLINWLGMPQSEFSYDAPVISRTTKKTGPPERRWQGSSGAFVPLPFQSGHGSARFDDRAIHLLRNARNLYNIRPHDRLVVYNYLQDRLRSEKSSPVMDLLKRYNNICGSIKSIRDANKIAYIQANNEIEVIGCTVTGLLKYSDIISGLRPQILLMEEAAEIREGDTIAGILPSIEHVVLLGDHQQLQPHVTMAELSREPYRINISMFERLIKQGVQHQTLLEQRRMIPCLRDIIQPFYPKLTDHAPTISKLPVDIPGVSQPLWWLQHDWPEAPGFANGDSVQNFQEAQMMVLFVEYLVTKQNFPPDRITMLTYYRGQVDLLNRELGSNLRLAACEAEWSVRTVDGFQGEENDIILLSLVRGPNGKAGFVTQENRAIVGLSRARLGLYIFGHKDVLVKDTPRGETWTKVIQQIKGNQGPGLPLCPYPDSDEVVRVNHPRQLRRLLREKKGRKARRTGQGSCSGSEAELQTIPTRTTSSRISGQGRAAKQGNSVGPETRLSKDSSRPGDLPALPQRGETDSVETLASELELISFDDVETIPLPQQFWPWDTTPLEPTPVAEEEIDLLDFEASEVATDGGGSNKFEMNKVAPAQVDLLS